MIPKLLQIGPFPLLSFGFSMVLAFLSSWRRLELSLKHAGKDIVHAEQIIFWAAVGGIVGARIGYILSYPQDFLADPLGMIFSGAGFVYYGGFIGGVISTYVYTRRAKIKFFEYADLTTPALAVGYAVGRIGCQLSGDGDYGVASDLPWAMSYALGVVPTEGLMRVHPAPIYETIAALIIAAVLVSLQRRAYYKVCGQLTGLFLLLTAVERFVVEIIRIEPRVSYGLTQAQIISLLLSALGLYMMRRRSEKGQQVAGN